MPRSSFHSIALVVVVAVTIAASIAAAQEKAALPDAPGSSRVLTAQVTTRPVPDADPQAAPSPLPSGPVITLDQALELAKKNSPTLRATRTLVLQNQAQEITANLRPNPVLAWDTQYLPLFDPSEFSNSNYWETQAQYDIGVGYLFERGKKRQHRLDAARTATAVTEAQVADAERTTLAAVAQAFVSALLARSNLDFAEQLLDSYKKTVAVSEEQYKAGAISKNDSLKIQLQQLQFENDVTSARIARAQAHLALRQLMGFDSVPAEYQVTGELAYQPLKLSLTDAEARALSHRPDLAAAQRSVTASESQVGLAKANGKVDVNVSFDYTRLNQNNLGAFYFNLPLPVFSKNQGEIARTQYAVTQSQFQQQAVEQQVLTDIRTAYETVRSNEEIVRLYDKGYLDKATQALDITRFSYEHGATSLLDFLDAERTYRSTQLSYRQALASYRAALEQLRQAVGSRDLQ
jgi:outer membrane protein, heavy metal efflux system